MRFLTNSFPSKKKVISDISSLKCAPVSRVCFSRGSGQFVVIEGSTVSICALRTIPLVSVDAELRFETQLKKHTTITSHTRLQPFAEVRPKTSNPHNKPGIDRLIIALYGDRRQASEYGRSQERINAVTDWLSFRNKSHRIPPRGLARVFYYLATNDVKAAIDETIDAQQPRLALLLASGTCNASKEGLVAQLDSWKRSGADAHIDEDVMRAYVLLSGGVHWRLSTGKDVTPLDGLNWTQQLSLLLLYASHEGLTDCVDFLITDTNDVEYHLIAGSSPWKTLSACSNELEAWFVHQSLQSYDAIRPNPHSDVIHGVLAAQLAFQDVRWASFVALHICDDLLRGYAVEEILGPAGNSLDRATQDWLEKALLLPKATIHEMKSVAQKAELEFKETKNNIKLDATKWQTMRDLIEVQSLDSLNTLLDSLNS